MDEEKSGLGGAQKMMLAVAAVFGIGFFLVGSNKESTDEQKKISCNDSRCC